MVHSRGRVGHGGRGGFGGRGAYGGRVVHPHHRHPGRRYPRWNRPVARPVVPGYYRNYNRYPYVPRYPYYPEYPLYYDDCPYDDCPYYPYY